MLKVFSLCDRKRAWTCPIKITVLLFWWKKVQWNFPSCHLFDDARKKKIQSRTRSHSRPRIKIGSLRCHYGYGKENVTKQLLKISKTTTLHVHHAFLYISLTSMHDYDKNCLLSRFIDKVSIRRRISLALFKLGYFSYEFNSRRVRLHKT